MKHSSSDFLAAAASSPELHKKLSSAKSADDVVKLAEESGHTVDRSELAATMRTIAGTELRKRGLPEWAINSMFLGEAVCW